MSFQSMEACHDVTLSGTSQLEGSDMWRRNASDKRFVRSCINENKTKKRPYRIMGPHDRPWADWCGTLSFLPDDFDGSLIWGACSAWVNKVVGAGLWAGSSPWEKWKTIPCGQLAGTFLVSVAGVLKKDLMVGLANNSTFDRSESGISWSWGESSFLMMDSECWGVVGRDCEQAGRREPSIADMEDRTRASSNMRKLHRAHLLHSAHSSSNHTQVICIDDAWRGQWYILTNEPKMYVVMVQQ